MNDLSGVEACLRAIVDSYADRLLRGEIYGMQILRRADANAHDWFAGVRVARASVKMFLLPMHTQPDLLDGLPPELLRRKAGASVFTVKILDDAEATGIADLVARAFPACIAKPAA